MSKKNVSAVISGMGVGMSILTSLREKAGRRGLSDEDFHRLSTPEGDAILERFVGIMAENARPVYKVEVNYYLNRAESSEAGKYDWVDSNITQYNFPVRGSGKQNIEIVLFHFNRLVSSDEAITEIDKAGCRIDDINEHLAFGAQHPELQKEFPIVCLGSVSQDRDGYCCVPVLRGCGAKRYLYLSRFEGDWNGLCRFAAVRKPK